MLSLWVVGISRIPEDDFFAIWLSITRVIFGKQVLKVIAAEFIDSPAWTFLANICEQAIDSMFEVLVKGFVNLMVIDKS